MASRPTAESRRVTSALTGMSLAVGIAREATDAVPIVKQCLGAALRIVALAERMDKDREALHSLSEKSLRLARRVEDVMKGRNLDAPIETSLERILKALESIELFIAKHSARSRLRRLIGYAFTVPQHVRRLSDELADAVQELIVVAMVDVHHQVHNVGHQVHTAHAAVADSASFVGEFRLLRHCEVDKLDVFREDKYQQDGSNLVVTYHSARVDGKLLVVRYWEGSSDEPTKKPPSLRMEACDLILKEISTVQRSHRNIARIYGWSKGSIQNRFTVFKSGYRPTEGIFDELPDPTISGIHWACKVLDAIEHLRHLGISWRPCDPPYALDEHLEPTIGLQDDLCRISPEADTVSDIAMRVFCTLYPPTIWSLSQEVAASNVQAVVAICDNEQLASVLGACGTVHRRRWVLRKAKLSQGLVLNNGTVENLLRVLAEEAFDANWQVATRSFADILLALHKAYDQSLKHKLRVIYTAEKNGSEWLDVHNLVEESEHIVNDWYYIHIPDVQRDKVKGMFGTPDPSTSREFHVIADG